jgi:hypothetical protein
VSSVGYVKSSVVRECTEGRHRCLGGDVHAPGLTAPHDGGAMNQNLWMVLDGAGRTFPRKIDSP